MYYAFDAYEKDLLSRERSHWESRRISTFNTIGNEDLTYEEFCKSYPIPGDKDELDDVDEIPNWESLENKYNDKSR